MLAVVLLIVLVSRTLALSRNKKPLVVFDTEEVRVVGSVEILLFRRIPA